MYITSRRHYLYTGTDQTWSLHQCVTCGLFEVDITIGQRRVSGAMPSQAHSRKAMPAEPMIAVAIIASQGILGFLVRILVDTGPSSVDRGISRRPVAARRLENGRFVKDGLVVCRVQLQEEGLPLLNELRGKSATLLDVRRYLQMILTSFCASTELSKNVSTPLLKSSTFSRSKRSSSCLNSRPMSSKSKCAW